MIIPRGRSAGVAGYFISILLLFISGQVVAEVTKKIVLEEQNYSRIVDSAGDYAGLEIIDLDEMMDTRGGFSVAGLDLKFGATLQTLIDNIKYETVFNITKSGAEIVSQVLSDISSLNEAMAATQQAAATNAGVTANNGTRTANNGTTAASSSATTATNVTTAGGSTTVLVGPETGVSIADVVPADISLKGLSADNSFSGIVISNNNGFTAALHRLTQKAAISTIISNASNQKINTKIDFQINVSNTKAAGSAAKAAAISRWANSGIR